MQWGLGGVEGFYRVVVIVVGVQDGVYHWNCALTGWVYTAQSEEEEVGEGRRERKVFESRGQGILVLNIVFDFG